MSDTANSGFKSVKSFGTPGSMAPHTIANAKTADSIVPFDKFPDPSFTLAADVNLNTPVPTLSVLSNQQLVVDVAQDILLTIAATPTATNAEAAAVATALGLTAANPCKTITFFNQSTDLPGATASASLLQLGANLASYAPSTTSAITIVGGSAFPAGGVSNFPYGTVTLTVCLTNALVGAETVSLTFSPFPL